MAKKNAKAGQTVHEASGTPELPEDHTVHEAPGEPPKVKAEEK